jgi:hypothetical protein
LNLDTRRQLCARDSEMLVILAKIEHLPQIQKRRNESS